MTPEEKHDFADLIVTATVKALGEKDILDHETHMEEHIWLREHIEREKMKADFYRKAGQTIFGTVIAALLIWLGSKGISFVVWGLKQ